MYKIDHITLKKPSGNGTPADLSAYAKKDETNNFNAEQNFINGIQTNGIKSATGNYGIVINPDGAINFNLKKLWNVRAPQAANEVANKEYVDNKFPTYRRVINHTTAINFGSNLKWTMTSTADRLVAGKMYDIVVRVVYNGQPFFFANKVCLENTTHANNIMHFKITNNTYTSNMVSAAVDKGDFYVSYQNNIFGIKYIGNNGTEQFTRISLYWRNNGDFTI